MNATIRSKIAPRWGVRGGGEGVMVSRGREVEDWQLASNLNLNEINQNNDKRYATIKLIN